MSQFPYMDSPLSESWQFSLILLLLLLAGSVGLWLFGSQLQIALKGFWNRQKVLDQVVLANRGHAFFVRYGYFMYCGLFATLLVGVLRGGVVSLPGEYVFVVFLSLIVLRGIVGLLQFVFSGLSSAFWESSDVLKIYWSYVRYNRAVLGFLSAPFVVVAVLVPQSGMWCLLLVGLLYLWHLVISFGYFREEKFYFSQWFLYLCAVEILPFLLVIALMKWCGEVFSIQGLF